MRLAQQIQRIKIQNIDPMGKTPLLDLINNQVRGTKDEHGEPISEVQCQCRGGFCGMCKVKVINGEYEMSEDAIKELCMEDKETLACSTKVKSSEIEVEYGM